MGHLSKMDSELSPGFFVDFGGKIEFVFCFGGLLNFETAESISILESTPVRWWIYLVHLLTHLKVYERRRLKGTIKFELTRIGMGLLFRPPFVLFHPVSIMFLS